MVCQICMVIYMLSETYGVKRDGTKVCKSCSYIPFSKYPQKRSAQKKKCGSAWLRKVKSSSGKAFVYGLYIVTTVLDSLWKRLLKDLDFWKNVKNGDCGKYLRVC